MADSIAAQRRRAALPGSPYDRLVSVLKILLPVAALAVFAVCLIWPLTARTEFSFILSKDRVASAGERLRVARAEYRGEDQNGQAFVITAASAIQKSSDVPVVEMQDITATLDAKDGPVHAVAGKGHYDMEHERMTADGPVRITGENGQLVNTRDVSLDMATRTIAGDSGVDGKLKLGTFRANRLRGDINSRVVTLIDRVHLHIVQRRA